MKESPIYCRINPTEINYLLINRGVLMKTLYLILIFCIILTACGNDKAANSSPGQENAFKPTLDVKLDVSGSQLTVTVNTDLTISSEHYGHERLTGEGHIHMYLDNGEKVGVQTKTKVFENLDPGHHSLKVSLHNNDHTPYDVTQTYDVVIK
jgi:hypothetical protein